MVALDFLRNMVCCYLDNLASVTKFANLKLYYFLGISLSQELTLPSKSSCDGCLTMDKFLSLPTLADITKVTNTMKGVYYSVVFLASVCSAAITNMSSQRSQADW